MSAVTTLEPLRDGIQLLTLRRPERLNALSWEMVDEIHAALAAVAADRSVRALILTGEGRGFCSGTDLEALAKAGGERGMVETFDGQEKLGEMALALRNLPQPAIAAVNGPAAGGGMALALACDVRVCSAEASFNVAFVRVGLSGCDVGVSHLLPRVVGLGVASELMLTGRRIDAEEALRIGLANSVWEAERTLDAAADLAEEMAANSPFALRMTKRVLGRNVDAPSLEAAIELENRTQGLATRTEDMGEALEAFREKRPPRFSGR